MSAYTHSGSTQDDTPVIDGTQAASIPIRDANGRLQAADPASGDTTQKLATTNWISQTGDSAPNNLMHRNGNETVYGVKSAVDYINQTPISSYPDIQKHSKVIPDNNNYLTMMRELTFDHNDNWLGVTEIAHTGADDKIRYAFSIFRNAKTCQLRMDVDANGDGHLFFYDGTTDHLIV